MHNPNNWSFIDSPTDLLKDCHNRTGGDLVYCICCHILGVLSGYVFPVVSLIGIFGNCVTAYVFLWRIKDHTRQMVYLGALAIADTLNLISFGWLWVFPSKGLPYATNAQVYFFTFNVSRTVCKVHRYLYSFTSCLACNLFLLTAVDRCLSIYLPFQLSRVRIKTAWICVVFAVLISSFLMLPFAIEVDHYRTKDGHVICWLNDGDTFLQLYHVLFSNCGLLQTTGIIGTNIMLLCRLRKRRTLQQYLHASSCSSGKEISACVTLLILSCIFVVCSLPMTTAYMLAFVFQHSGESLEGQVRFAYNVSDIGWHLFFMQESMNWIVYLKRMSSFRREVKAIFACCLPSRFLNNENTSPSSYCQSPKFPGINNGNISNNQEKPTRSTEVCASNVIKENIPPNLDKQRPSIKRRVSFKTTGDPVQETGTDKRPISVMAQCTLSDDVSVQPLGTTQETKESPPKEHDNGSLSEPVTISAEGSASPASNEVNEMYDPHERRSSSIASTSTSDANGYDNGLIHSHTPAVPLPLHLLQLHDVDYNKESSSVSRGGTPNESPYETKFQLIISADTAVTRI